MFDPRRGVESDLCVDAIIKLFRLCFDSILEANRAWLDYNNERISKSAFLSKHRKALRYTRIIDELGLQESYLFWRDERDEY